MSSRTDTHVLPSSYDSTRNTDSLFHYMRNNVCDASHALFRKLMGSVYVVRGEKELYGGFPRMTMPRDSRRFDQILNTNFFESVGTYQALNQDNSYRLNGLNLFAIGYILRPFASYLVNLKFRMQLLIDGVICTMLEKFQITYKTTDTSIDKTKDYHEVYGPDETNIPVVVGDVDHERPKITKYYGKIPSGSICTGTLSGESVDYYYYDDVRTTFVKCVTLTGTFYTKTADDTFTVIGNHVIGALEGKDIYRLIDGVYVNVGTCSGRDVVIIGKTRNNMYSGTDECWLYRGILSSQDNSLLNNFYLDMQDEDVELIKKDINILLTHYRSILAVTGRRRPKYREIIPSTRYTTADLIVRLNAFVRCLDCGIDPVAENGYCVRNLKLKINEVIDAIVGEKFFTLLVDRTSSIYAKYGLGDILRDLYSRIKLSPQGWIDLLDSAERTHVHQSEFPDQFEGYSYNDLSIVYVPENIDRNTSLFDMLRLEDYGMKEPGLTFVPPSGYILKRFLRDENKCPPLAIVSDDSSLNLSDIIDLPHIADVWRNCDYTGSMYVIDRMLDLFDSRTASGKPWLDGISHPTVEFDDQSILDDLRAQVEELVRKTRLVLGLAPLAAMMMTDLSFRTVDYAVVEEQRK